MAQTRLQQLNISFTVRRASRRGPTSSWNYNDGIDEISNDFTALYNEWNNYLYPLTLTLPNGSPDSNVNAFSNGLDGQNMYVDSDASATVNPSYYNSINSRPNTIFEQFANVYTYIDGINTTLSNSIDGVVFSAASISVVDTGNLYTATNVEDALSEVREIVDDYADASIYVPLTGGTMTGSLYTGAKIGIGTTTPAASAVLDITSTTGTLLVSRMSTVQRNALTAVVGMVIYNLTTGRFQGYATAGGAGWKDLH